MGTEVPQKQMGSKKAKRRLSKGGRQTNVRPGSRKNSKEARKGKNECEVW